MAQVSKPPERRPQGQQPAPRGNPAPDDACGSMRSRTVVDFRRLQRSFRKRAVPAFPHAALEHFRAKWTPARIKEFHQNGYLQTRSDFIEARDAVVSWYRSQSSLCFERLAKHRDLYSRFSMESQKGATMLEYGLLASLIALAITVAATLLAGQAAPPG